MKILITGADGQLGQTLIDILNQGKSPIGEIPKELVNCEICALDIHTLDITDCSAVLNTFKTKNPQIVINCAAYTAVDNAEEEWDTAFNVNAKGVENLVKGCKAIGAKLLHISTDYVFDGKSTTPYTEDDTPNPKTVYGKTKLQGEKYALGYEKTFVIRTAWLYGKNGNNFVKTMLRLGDTRNSITVVNDQKGTPTNAGDLAHHILKLGVTENYGIYHCTGEGECTWYDFACEIMQFSGKDCKVMPCTTDEYPTKAVRPAYSVLENKALRLTVGNEMRHWKTALQEFITKSE